MVRQPQKVRGFRMTRETYRGLKRLRKELSCSDWDDFFSKVIIIIEGKVEAAATPEPTA